LAKRRYKEKLQILINLFIYLLKKTKKKILASEFYAIFMIIKEYLLSLTKGQKKNNTFHFHLGYL